MHLASRIALVGLASIILACGRERRIRKQAEVIKAANRAQGATEEGAVKRILFLAMSVMIVVAFAMPRSDAGAIQKGKGKGGGGEKTILVGKLTLHDLFAGAALLSDGKERTQADSDIDGFLELAGSTDPGGLVFYQDHRIAFDDPDNPVHPDPCTQLNITDGGTNGGRARALLNFSSCSVDNPQYANDARTFTLVFDRNQGDPNDPTEGGSCACDQFTYLIDSSGNPTPMYNGEPAKTLFVDNPVTETCTLTPAAGAIETDSENNRTGSQQFIAYPYEDLMGKKGKNRSQSVPGFTTVHINFRTDRLVAGDPNGWLLWSQEESILIDLTADDPDDRVVTADNDLFDLALAGNLDPPRCANVEMSFQATFKRFTVTVPSK